MKKAKPERYDKRPENFLEVVARRSFGGDWIPMFWTPVEERDEKGRFLETPDAEAAAKSRCVAWIRQHREASGRTGIEYRIQTQNREIVP